MARLNEPPLPTESIEVVKRRFIRQNRELAKHNSAQSIRIRNLEIQASQLLTENIALRERIAELQGQVDGTSSRNGVAVDIVSSVKARLEDKMHDIALLVAELGDSTRPKATRTRRRTANTAGLQEWHDAAAAAMAEAGPQYRLESIREDKHFPRRTLNAEEIHNIVSASESPDLGPPPVARFDEIDPVKFDPPAAKSEDSQQQEQETDSLEPPFSINLETRRKRKDAQPRLDIRRLSVFQSPAPDKADSTDEELAQTQVLPIRAGAKRKLSARDVEDKPATATTTAPREPFEFSRRTAASRSSETPKLAQKKPTSTSDRKALGTKNANFDVVNSPKKTAKDKPDKSSDDARDFKPAPVPDTLEGRRNREKRPKPSIIDPSDLAQSAQLNTVGIILEPTTLPPKTPATLDIFSPTSTEASATQPRDTPEPYAAHGEIPGAGRPGRRARSQVNYAEPSLNTKMRRPGKELADAVSKQGKPVAVRAEARLKKESEESTASGDDWKALPAIARPIVDKEVEAIGEPNSPLRDKTMSLSQALRDQKRQKDKLDAVRNAEKEAAAAVVAAESASEGSNGASGPAALTSTMRKRLGRPAPVLPASVADAQLEGMSDEVRESLAVFDFNESSPREGSGSSSASSAKATLSGSSQARTSRRHSSVPALSLAQDLQVSSREGPAHARASSKDSNRPGGSGSGSESTMDSITAARRERAASRRRSMML